jgi:hypothetical protein
MRILKPMTGVPWNPDSRGFENQLANIRSMLTFPTNDDWPNTKLTCRGGAGSFNPEKP